MYLFFLVRAYPDYCWANVVTLTMQLGSHCPAALLQKKNLQRERNKFFKGLMQIVYTYQRTETWEEKYILRHFFLYVCTDKTEKCVHI